MGKEAATLPNPEEITAGGESLSDEQREMIKESIETPWDQEEPKKKPEEKDDDKVGDDDADDKEEKDDKDSEDQDDQEDDEDSEAEAKEQERLEKKAKELEKTVDEVIELEKSEKSEQDRIAAVAKEEGISTEQVIENEAKDKSIAERHGNDPLKMGRAIRMLQSEHDKIKTETEELRTFRQGVEEAQRKNLDKEFNRVAEEQRDRIVDQYRKSFPDEAEESDDTLFERGKAIMRKNMEKNIEKKEAEFKEKADDRRKEILAKLPEEFNEFKKEIKEAVGKCSDADVMDPEFDVMFFANYQRGLKFTPEYVKSLKDAAKKDGEEKPTIRGPVKKKTGTKPSPYANLVSQATDVDRKRAVQIYGRRQPSWSEDKMVAEYMKNDKKYDF